MCFVSKKWEQSNTSCNHVHMRKKMPTSATSVESHAIVLFRFCLEHDASLVTNYSTTSISPSHSLLPLSKYSAVEETSTLSVSSGTMVFFITTFAEQFGRLCFTLTWNEQMLLNRWAGQYIQYMSLLWYENIYPLGFWILLYCDIAWVLAFPSFRLGNSIKSDHFLILSGWFTCYNVCIHPHQPLNPY